MAATAVDTSETFASLASTNRNFINDGKYMLPSDEKEKPRLNHQHDVVRYMIQAHGDPWPILVPETFQFKLQPGDRVLDSATGTAVWLLEAAAATSTAVGADLPDDNNADAKIHFDGIDLSSVHFPTQETLQSATSNNINITLSTGNILQFPESWSNKYALVHQRFLWLALSRTQWQQNISEIARILQPGGWVTFLETGLSFGGLASQKFNKAVTLTCQNMDYFRDAGPMIVRFLNETGSFDVETVTMKTYKYRVGKKVRMEEGGDPELEKNFVDLAAKTFAVFGLAVINNGGVGVREIARDEEEWAALIDELVKEWEEIDEAWSEIRLVCARKKMN